MQVFFLKNIKGFAQKGDIKNVKEGYFQNYLFPNKIAILATLGKIKESEEIRKKALIDKERLSADAKDVKKRLENIEIVLIRKSHDAKLYASITEKDIIDEILKIGNVKLGKENILLLSPIKNIGDYEIIVKILDNVEFRIMLKVKGE